MIVIFLGAAIIFGITFNFFIKPIKDWNWVPYTIIGIWAALSIGLIVLTFVFSYYEVYKKYVTVKRAGKSLIYYYSDVVYIDEKQSEKSKMVCFYTKQGHSRYLMFDSKGILYKVMLANCKNRLTEEEFKERYPKVKL